MKKFSGWLIVTLISVWGSLSFAQEHEILMLDEGAEGMMVFEPSFLKIEKGDSVKFISKHIGHVTMSAYTPKGANPWKGGVSADLAVSFDQQGVYIYSCDLHKPLGMVGVIQVGEAINLPEAKKAAESISAELAMGQDRLSNYLAKVK